MNMPVHIMAKPVHVAADTWLDGWDFTGMEPLRARTVSIQLRAKLSQAEWLQRPQFFLKA